MSNLWERFAALLPDQSLQVGQAVALYDDGSIGLKVPNGIVRVLTGGISVSLGANFFYRNGRIEGAAPGTPVINVTIY